MERNEKIKELRTKEKLTLEEIGSKFNITRERVRQIIGNMTNSKEELYGKVRTEYCANLGSILKTDLYEEINRLSKEDRRKEIVMQRTALVKKLHDSYGFNFNKIALLLKRDHTSILHLYRK